MTVMTASAGETLLDNAIYTLTSFYSVGRWVSGVMDSRACHILQKMKILEKMQKNTDIILRNAILKHIYCYHIVEKYNLAG